MNQLETLKANVVYDVAADFSSSAEVLHRPDVEKLIETVYQARTEEVVEIVNGLPFHYSDIGFGTFIDKDDLIATLKDTKISKE